MTTTPARAAATARAPAHTTIAAAIRATTNGWAWCPAGCGWPLDPDCLTNPNGPDWTTHPGCQPPDQQQGDQHQ